MIIQVHPKSKSIQHRYKNQKQNLLLKRAIKDCKPQLNWISIKEFIRKRKDSLVINVKWLFQCDSCDMKFLQLCHLITHKRTHSGEKPYQCDICPKNFARSDQLTLHKRTHTGEKPYECDSCHKKFSDPSGLRRHNTRVHAWTRPYSLAINVKNHFLN